MATGVIGIKAVLQLDEFQKARKEYERALQDMEKKAQKTAQATTRSTKGVATSMDELSQSSRVLQEAMGTLKPETTMAAFQELGTVFGELGPKAQVNVELFDRLADAGLGLDQSLRVAASGVGVNTALFDKFINQGISAEGALQAATGATGSLASAMQAGAAVGAIYTAALKAAVDLVRESIADYTAFAEQVRKVSYQLGISAEEASGWVRTAEAAGLSAVTFQRALTTLSDRMTDMRLAQIEGKGSANDFTRTMDLLGISVTRVDGTMKSAQEVMTEVNDAVRELGPGVASMNALMDVYGYAGRDMVTVVHNQSISIEELQERARELGALTTTLSQEQYEEWKRATAELQLATAGLKAHIAKQWIPVLTELADILVGLIDKYRRLIAAGESYMFTALAIVSGDIKLAQAAEFRQAALNHLLGIENEATRTENELIEARRRSAQEALLVAKAERERANALKEDLNEAYADLAEAQEDYANKLLDIDQRFRDKWEDLREKWRRQDIENALKWQYQLEDLQRKHQDRLADIDVDKNRELRDIQNDLAKKLRRFDEDAHRAREKLLRRHKDRLYKIETKYLDTVEEAARDNDAVAIVRAIRTRNRQLRDEERRYTVEQKELEEDLAIKRARLIEDAAERKQREIDEANDKRRRLEDQYQRELAALQEKQRREREAIARQRQWEREDQDRAYERAYRDAETAFLREEQQLREHIDRMNAELQTGILAAGAIVAGAVGVAMRQIATTAQQQIEAVGRGVLYTPPQTTREYPQAPGIEAWYDRYRRRQHGGIDIVNRPTKYLAGEGGAEIAAFIPLRGGVSVQHSFGTLRHDFGGMPGGLNTTQAEAIVYGAMMELARALGVSGRRR